MTIEELDAARDAGTRLEELGEAQEVVMGDIQAAAKAARIAQVNSAVAQGDTATAATLFLPLVAR